MPWEAYSVWKQGKYEKSNSVASLEAETTDAASLETQFEKNQMFRDENSHRCLHMALRETSYSGTCFMLSISPVIGCDSRHSTQTFMFEQ